MLVRIIDIIMNQKGMSPSTNQHVVGGLTQVLVLPPADSKNVAYILSDHVDVSLSNILNTQLLLMLRHHQETVVKRF